MSSYQRLGPIVNEPRKKYRIRFAPATRDCRFCKVLVWDTTTAYYTPVSGEDITVQDGEVLDYFMTVGEDGEVVNIFARQLDDRLFMLNQETVDGAIKEPGKGNNQNFWLQEI